MTEAFTWARRGGYECSSKGDNRFSALYARLPDGRTIEQHYQCDVKGYEPGGTDWRLGKGKPALSPHTENSLYEAYKELWRLWAADNMSDMEDLLVRVREHDNILSDCFASTPINQANALAELLSEYRDELQRRLNVRILHKNLTVWNKHHGEPPGKSFYIGRGSPLGNPFASKQGTKASVVVKTKEEAIEAYGMWLEQAYTAGVPAVVDMIHEIERSALLEPVYLICFCAPKTCHGDILRAVIVGAID